MEKKVFYKYQMFYSFLILLLSVLIIWNIYNAYLGTKASIFSIIIQVVMMILLVQRHEKTKIAFKIWSILVMAGSGLKFISGIITVFIGDDSELFIEPIIISLLMIILGYIVYAYNERDVYVDYVKKEEENVL